MTHTPSHTRSGPTVLRGILIGAIPILLAVGVMFWLAGRRHAEPEYFSDQLLRLPLNAGTFRDVDATDDGLRLSESAGRGYPRHGVWISQPISTDGMTELLPSWNADCPPHTGVRFSARTRDAVTGAWSPWLDYGYWGQVPPSRFDDTFPGGKVKVDILKLNHLATSAQVRCDFYSFDIADLNPDRDNARDTNPNADANADVNADAKTDVNPTLRQFTLAARQPTDHAVPEDQPTTPVDLDVPFLFQRSAGNRIGGEVCSPTSTTMVADYYGVEPHLVENALAIYDTEHDIFGGWNRAVQRAAELGLAGHLERFTNWAKVQDYLLEGRPVIASINFKRGQCPSFLLNSTNGHLIVIRGITETGDLIVNDGASPEHGEGAVYAADDLRTAWFENGGGVGYVLYPRDDDADRPQVAQH